MNVPEYSAPPSADGPSQRRVVDALLRHLPSHAVLWTDESTTPYECDGLTAYRQRPLAVALPETDAQVQQVLRTCHALQVPVVARGAGTGLSLSVSYTHLTLPTTPYV